MPRFNPTLNTVRILSNTPNATNLAGGQAYALNPKEQLATILVTSMCADQFYRTCAAGVEDIRSLLDILCKTEEGAQFAAKAAIYARQRMGVRSVTHVAIAELAHRVKGCEWTKQAYKSAIRRPDDMTEIISYYIEVLHKPIPNSLKKAMRSSFEKFDAYQLAKYKGDGHALTLRDLVRILHPKPTEGNAEALRLLAKNELKNTETWETKLSAAGNTENKELAKSEAWSSLIAEHKLGYLAMLRNLRNIIKDAPQSLDACLAFLSDAQQVAKGNAFPYQIYLALHALVERDDIPSPIKSKVSESLSKALDASMACVPMLPGKTLILLDDSGSMLTETVGGEKSSISVAAIGALFAAMLLRKCEDAHLALFDTRVEEVRLFPANVLADANAIMSRFHGGGTDFTVGFNYAQEKYERIIILSDMQGWLNSTGLRDDTSAVHKAFADYCKRTGAKPYLYSWDLAGYGTIQLPRSRVFLMAGFGNAAFNQMTLLEQDKQALIHEIESVKFETSKVPAEDSEDVSRE